jgi:hypothetical protein
MANARNGLIHLFSVSHLYITNYAFKYVNCLQLFKWVIVHFNYFWNFHVFLARQPQDLLLHRFPPVKPCATENFPYPLVILKRPTHDTICRTTT